MLYIEVLLLAIGLSMDSLAVSVTGGAVLKSNCTAGNIIKIASVLGIFQAGMTVIGYTMGLGFEKYICAFDHWIAFTLLLYLGGKMIYDSTKEEEEDGKFDPLCNRTLCGLGNTCQSSHTLLLVFPITSATKMSVRADYQRMFSFRLGRVDRTANI